jgi:hypothetical protein
MDLGAQFLANARFETRRLKALAEKAIAQVEDDALLHHALDPESNSIAVVMQHIGGNLRSRWTQFLTTDGEKPDRNRDGEFEPTPARTRRELLELWEHGWSPCLDTLDAMSPGDLSKTVRIRGEELRVSEAIQRSLLHSSYHVGQIVLLAKHLASTRWTSLSIPRGGSAGAPGAYKKS